MKQAGVLKISFFSTPCNEVWAHIGESQCCVSRPTMLHACCKPACNGCIPSFPTTHFFDLVWLISRVQRVYELLLICAESVWMLYVGDVLESKVVVVIISGCCDCLVVTRTVT